MSRHRRGWSCVITTRSFRWLSQLHVSSLTSLDRSSADQAISRGIRKAGMYSLAVTSHPAYSILSGPYNHMQLAVVRQTLSTAMLSHHRRRLHSVSSSHSNSKAVLPNANKQSLASQAGRVASLGCPSVLVAVQSIPCLHPGLSEYARRDFVLILTSDWL